jgi:chemotaxis protein histidine kinase CheA
MNINTTPAPDLSLFRPRFLAGLNRRVAELTGHAARLEQRDHLDAAMRLFHSITGMAGTFGFPDLTTISRRAEVTCARALAAGAPLTEPECNVVVETIGRLRLACSVDLHQAA